ncbi:cell division protein FtsB [Sulfuriflexus sp.]|uniref:cell division protein FtsB n=1 Tax=Sulfuriflexus sp. TaxID=2015443 RepID=UPI0028CEC1B7|nr:cell division protein FtsB [Sulfuriflexus sp.]MDT8402965.1 cell division protein FtsB [Sulfuriflexus sp.]
MKFLTIFLVLLLITLQLTLWFGHGSLAEVWQLRQQISAQQDENNELQERNAALEAEVEDLKQGLAAIEERARHELGMIKKDETFFQVVEEEADTGK